MAKKKKKPQKKTAEKRKDRKKKKAPVKNPLIVTGLVLAGLFLLFLFLLGISIEMAVIDFGPKLIGAPIELKSSFVNPLTATVHMKELIVRNPEGFHTPSAAEFKHLKIRFAVSSLFRDTVIIKEIRSNGAKITYERALWSSNLGTIQNNAETPAKKEMTGGKPQKKILIRRVQLDNTKIYASVTAAGGRSIAVSTKSIYFNNESAKGDPFAAMNSVLSSINTAAADASIAADRISDNAGEVLSPVKKRIGNYLQKK